MGRELKRKQAKKEGKNLKEELYKNNEVKENNEIYNFLKISVILIVILGIIYLLVGIFITKEIDLFNSNNKETTTNNNVSNKILAGSIFNQKEEEYYVYFYNFDEPDSSTLSIINSELSKDTVYKVDTSDSLNQNYVTDSDSNSSATSLEDLLVKHNTLIKIVNDEIVSYYEDDEIKDNLK